MKSFLVIGLGRFGIHLSKYFAELGNEVMAIDRDENIVNSIADDVTYAQTADCRSEEVLRCLSVNSFDTCFVCVGGDFQSSLEITYLLKELGAKRVVSKASTENQEKFLLRNGADAVIYPEKNFAEKLAAQYSANNVFDYYKLSGDVAIYETIIPKSWVGKSVKELDVRKVHNINILGIKRDNIITSLDVESRFESGDHLLVFGTDKNINKLTKES